MNTPLVLDPIETAKEAGLHYTHDDTDGLKRKKAGRHFAYFTASGEKITDKKNIERITKLRIPPAWKNVWISPDPKGHLQATGYDERKRKQYRYHAEWSIKRNENKFTRMIAFSKKLPAIREQVDKDLSSSGLSKEKVLATIIRLLECSCIRVGNEEYAATNASYGLTTMKNRHVDVEGSTIVFHFKGKSNVKHNITVKDRKLARIIANCKDLPGQRLFEYEDENGMVHLVHSDDVNEYLKTVTNDNFTAKDFRTWMGTALAALELKKIVPFETETQAHKNFLEAVKAVASILGNRPATCRKYYIHPAIEQFYMEKTLSGLMNYEKKIEKNGLYAYEESVVRILKKYERDRK